MTPQLPLTRDLVLIGGGHTHALVLHKWGMNRLAGARLTLINPDVTAPYTGMLPGYVAGHYQREQLNIDLVKLARHAGARLVLDKAVGIDLERKRVQLANRPEISYDTLSINVGITSDLPLVLGFQSHALGAKPLGPFANAWDEFLQRVKEFGLTPKIAIIGAGVAGAELALAMAYRLEQEEVVDREITLIEATDQPLREVSKVTRQSIQSELERYRVALMLDAKVSEVKSEQVVFEGYNASIDANFIVSAAGARPHAWISDLHLPLENGFVSVDKYLQVQSTPNVFASGDCAHLAHAPRPKAGVYAVREAPVLWNNLRADVSGGRMKYYHPQRDYLKLVSTGRKSAIADKFGIAFKGGWLWRVKDKIDRDFMDQFAQSQLMPSVGLPDDAAFGVEEMVGTGEPLCSGCGSKVGRLPLLSGLEADANHSDFDDAAIIEAGPLTEVFTTDHLKSFTDDPWVIGRVAALHAMGDVWAMGGVPKQALSTLILPNMSASMHADAVREVMASARAAFHEAGARIVGGHTSIGSELTVGFSVRGTVERDAITHSGAQEGDILVLTKPIGTGVILAAEMRQLVEPNAYKLAIDSMMRSQSAAAKVLAKSATAMTDVTGFGLAGHLLSILEASNVSAELELDAIPLLQDALRLSELGVRSSIWGENASAANRMSLSASPRSDLLFDPQTSGGLLACVPSHQIEGTLSEFRQVNEPAVVIGRIRKGGPHLIIV